MFSSVYGAPCSPPHQLIPCLVDGCFDKSPDVAHIHTGRHQYFTSTRYTYKSFFFHKTTLNVLFMQLSGRQALSAKSIGRSFVAFNLPNPFLTQFGTIQIGGLRRRMYVKPMIYVLIRMLRLLGLMRFQTSSLIL